jgi:hypothetical protein
MPGRRPAALFATFAILAPGALAFASVPPGTSPHDDITEEASRQADWPGGTGALEAAVRAPDADETEYDPDLDEPMRIDAGEAFRWSHHCDRQVGNASAYDFLATARYVAHERSEALAESGAGDASAALKALGRALHAIQDCYSHSNAVDLAADEQARMHRVLLSGNGTPPEGLRLTSFDPGADDPERPDGDEYNHGDFAKDKADHNEESKLRLPSGQTKYERAHELAVDASAAFLASFRDTVTAEEWDDLGKVDADVVPKAWPVPSVPAWTVVALLALAAVARWGFTPK